MKKLATLFSIALTVTLIVIISCNKKNDDPIPVERKKCAWAVGDMDSTGYGIILFSADSGETWVRQGEGSTALFGISLMDIWAVDDNNVWAVGTGNSILRTKDGGNAWSKIVVPGTFPNNSLMCISIINKTNIWISGGHGVIYNSIDNGNTWNLIDTTIFPNAGLQGNRAISSEKIYVVGAPGTKSGEGLIGYTLDSGTTWDSVILANDYNKNEWIGVTSSGNTIVVYGGKSHYVVSTDGGATWKNDSIPQAGGGGADPDINHMIMLDPKTWWGAMDMGHICYTEDGGSNWDIQKTDQGGYYLVGIDAWDSSLALSVGEGVSFPVTGTLVKTSDGGKTWERKLLNNSGLQKVTFIKQ